MEKLCFQKNKRAKAVGRHNMPKQILQPKKVQKEEKHTL